MFPALYAILDITPATTIASAISLAMRVVSGGAGLIQLRAKLASSGRYYEMSRELAGRLAPAAADQPGVRFIVNDRPDLAALVGAAGVHVGQDDLPVEDARRFCPPPRWVGVSTHNLEQLRAADFTSADYIAVGPIFPTTTKENPDPVVGLDFLREARKITRKPLVAIGGIKVKFAADVYRAGANSIAVSSDLSVSPDPAQRVREYLEIARSVLGNSA